MKDTEWKELRSGADGVMKLAKQIIMVLPVDDTFAISVKAKLKIEVMQRRVCGVKVVLR